MTLSTKLMTLLIGKKVGSDEFGNKYYRYPRKNRREKRWVVYKNDAEPSTVTAEWWGWLHHKNENPPTEVGYKRHQWQKPHQANMTGTDEAYRPEGHIFKGGKRAAATGDYEAWTPENSAASETADQ